jgi:outer membrane protein assembly factor BamB
MMQARTAGIAAAVVGVAAGAWAAWPEFRGPTGDGHVPAASGALPTEWSETNRVAWKTPIPHKGWSTPVVLEGRVWLTTATPDGRDFFAVCLDAATGAARFNGRIFHTDTPEPLGNEMNGYASPSPAIEPGRVYVHFGSYGTACLDAETGRIVWQRTDLPCRHYRGPGSSPAMFRDLLILTMDGVDLQYVVALDRKTGKTVWKTDRSAVWNDLGPDGLPLKEGDLRKAYSTPLVGEVNGRPQVFTVGAKAAYGYDAENGKELWKIVYPQYSAAARPVFSHGLVFVSSGAGKSELWAIRPEGRGDVTTSHIAWKATKSIPRIPSPIVVGDLLYLTGEDGGLQCLEAATGTEVWKERIGGNYAASPICANGLLYFCSQQGKTAVVKAGRAFVAVATNKLDDGFMASPAVDGRALILRTKTHVYRIGDSAAR